MNREDEILWNAVEAMAELDVEKAFELKARFLGGISDVNTLRRLGWRLVSEEGKPVVRGDSRWLEKEFCGRRVVLEAGVPQREGSAGNFERYPMRAEGDELQAMWKGASGMPCFLRGIQVDPDEDGQGMALSDWPQDVQALLGVDLGEAEEAAPLPFAADLEWQTRHYECEDPWPLATDEERMLAVLCQVVDRQRRNRWSAAA